MTPTQVNDMAQENTGVQFAISPHFADEISGALVAVANDSAPMPQAAMVEANPRAGLARSLANVAALTAGE